MNEEKRHSPETPVIALLICAFAASVLFVLILGTRIYSSMSSASERAYYERTVLSFAVEKLRHGDGLGPVSVGEFDGLNALYLESELGGTAYTSILYCYDGWLYELFCEKGLDFSREDGTKILRAASVRFSEEKPRLIRIEATDEAGHARGLSVHLRSGGKI